MLVKIDTVDGPKILNTAHIVSVEEAAQPTRCVIFMANCERSPVHYVYATINAIGAMIHEVTQKVTQ